MKYQRSGIWKLKFRLGSTGCEYIGAIMTGAGAI
jgi:hypothetical protein